MSRTRKRHQVSAVRLPGTPPRPVAHGRAAGLVLLAFAAVFIALQVNAYTRKSATWDEPIHLTSGYLALAHSDYRVDPSHPPFVRMWGALPMWLAGQPVVNTAAI